MARPLRLEVEDGWYHLTARGNERRTIYRRAQDYRHFLELLGELDERFGVRVAAYALMPNHYHLLIRLGRRELSRAMQWLNLSYGAWFNAAHGRSGHVFQGRFHGVLIEDEGSWVLEASTYIHLNPVRVAALGLHKRTRPAERRGILPAPTAGQVRERLDVLRAYRWSSYRATVGLEDKPDWLAADELLRRVGGAREYQFMVENGVRQGEPEPWLSRIQMGLAFGSEPFAEQVRQLATRPNILHREHPHRRSLVSRVDLKQVVRAVEGLKGEPCVAFRDRHGDSGRDLIWWAGRRFGGLPLATLAAWAGGVDYSTVSAAVGRLSRRARADRALQEDMRRLGCELSNAKT